MNDAGTFAGTTVARHLVSVVDFQSPFDPCRITGLALGQRSARPSIKLASTSKTADKSAKIHKPMPLPLGLMSLQTGKRLRLI